MKDRAAALKEWAAVIRALDQGDQMLLLRKGGIAEPQWISVLPEYSGCSSWLELKAPLTAEGAVPVLSDEEYAARVEAVKRSLGL